MKTRVPIPLIQNCNDCGVCCHGQEALPVSWYVSGMLPGDPATLPPELLAELEHMLAEFKAHGFPRGKPCVWFDAEQKQCKHYEYRPELCQTELAPGDDTCRRLRKQAGMDGAKRFAMKAGKVTEVPR